MPRHWQSPLHSSETTLAYARRTTAAAAETVVHHLQRGCTTEQNVAALHHMEDAACSEARALRQWAEQVEKTARAVQPTKRGARLNAWLLEAQDGKDVRRPIIPAPWCGVVCERWDAHLALVERRALDSQHDDRPEPDTRLLRAQLAAHLAARQRALDFEQAALRG